MATAPLVGLINITPLLRALMKLSPGRFERANVAAGQLVRGGQGRSGPHAEAIVKMASLYTQDDPSGPASPAPVASPARRYPALAESTIRPFLLSMTNQPQRAICPHSVSPGCWPW